MEQSAVRRWRQVSGAGNLEACAAAEVVVLATPFSALEATVTATAPALAGKLVVSAVIPLRVADNEISVLDVDEGSAAQMVAARLHGGGPIVLPPDAEPASSPNWWRRVAATGVGGALRW